MSEDIANPPENATTLPPNGFAMIPMRWVDAGLTPTALRLLLRISHHDRRSEESKGMKPGCIRSVTGLAKDMGIERRHASRALSELMHRGAVVAGSGCYGGGRALRVVWEGVPMQGHPRPNTGTPPVPTVVRFPSQRRDT